MILQVTRPNQQCHSIEGRLLSQTVHGPIPPGSALSAEAVLLIFPILQTNITSQMWPSGGKGAASHKQHHHHHHHHYSLQWGDYKLNNYSELMINELTTTVHYTVNINASIKKTSFKRRFKEARRGVTLRSCGNLYQAVEPAYGIAVCSFGII